MSSSDPAIDVPAPADTAPRDDPGRPVPKIGHRPEVVRSVAPFEVVSEYSPAGDQPAAIAEIARRHGWTLTLHHTDRPATEPALRLLTLAAQARGAFP